ncbi:MAG: hypothetical protein HY900_27740 [Deltaproteobacteria bacterium]|nr:hypothetical protein [Deltaproteobacteria bacterium]
MAAVRVVLAAALLLSSAAVLFATWRSATTARRLGDQAIERTALALGTSVEKAISTGKSGKELREILSDRIVAYALVAGRDGTIRFHLNPELVGTRLPPSGPDALVPSDGPVLRRITLGLGTPAYAYDYPLASGQSAETLRLVLHVGATERLGREARQLWLTVSIVVSLLTGAGIALDRMLFRLLALRDEMDRRERLSLIGQMTATLAHEVRNALWGVKGYAQWLDEKLSPEHPGKPDVSAIVEGTDRIEGIVDALLQYSREETYHLEPVLVGPVLDDALSEAATGWPGVLQNEAGDGASVLADREKLRRVIVNGLRNALDAMGAGGTLTVRVGEVGRLVSIAIEDTGGGLTPEAAGQVFTPFFTTKTNGTGLGLAYSRKVIEGMGGEIHLQNGTEGAVLTIRLPHGEDV